MKIAQYGIGHDHAAGKAKVMRDSNDVEFAGVFEPSADILAICGKNPSYEGVAWFKSKEELLEDATIEAVAVEGKVSQNLEFAQQVIEKGKHVWLDKPAGDDFEMFSSLLAMAEERNLHVQLGYMFRYNSAFQQLINWSKNGFLGTIRSIHATIPTGSVGKEHWERWDSAGEMKGGIMFVLACHVIDIIVALLGRPEKVTPYLRENDKTFPWYRDNTLAILEYPDTLVTVEAVANRLAHAESRKFEVHGTEGSVIIEPLEPPQMKLFLNSAKENYSAGWQKVAAEARVRYVESLRSFISTIRGTQKADRTQEHELIVQETVLAAAGIRPL